MTHVKFLTVFHARYGETKKVSLLLNLGGLGMAEMYEDKIIFRYGHTIPISKIEQRHKELSADVIEIIDDGGQAYESKIKNLISVCAK